MKKCDITMCMHNDNYMAPFNCDIHILQVYIYSADKLSQNEKALSKFRVIQSLSRIDSGWSFRNKNGTGIVDNSKNEFE